MLERSGGARPSKTRIGSTTTMRGTSPILIEWRFCHSWIALGGTPPTSTINPFATRLGASGSAFSGANPL